MTLIAVLVSLLLALVATELWGWLGILSRMIIWLAALLLQPSRRAIRRREWVAELHEFSERRIAGVLWALSLLPVAAWERATEKRHRSTVAAGLARYTSACVDAADEVFRLEEIGRWRGLRSFLAFGASLCTPGAFWAVPLLGFIRLGTGRLSPAAGIPFGAPLTFYWYSHVLQTINGGKFFDLIGFGGMLVSSAVTLIVHLLALKARQRRVGALTS